MSEQPVETQAETTPTTPETETVKGEPYDAARAMLTIEKLRAEIKELKPKARQAEELTQAEQKRKEAEMTELQKLQAELEKARSELKRTQLDELKRQAAIKAELPLVFADRLRGETPEELEADAKLILGALPKAPKTPAVNPTNPGPGASQGETVAQALARIHGQSVDVLNPSFAREHGGGVVIREKHLAPPE
jgi:multidrug efflux pump subunit AcrA (membrane-fusion protein)